MKKLWTLFKDIYKSNWLKSITSSVNFVGEFSPKSYLILDVATHALQNMGKKVDETAIVFSTKKTQIATISMIVAYNRYFLRSEYLYGWFYPYFPYFATFQGACRSTNGNKKNKNKRTGQAT